MKTVKTVIWWAHICVGRPPKFGYRHVEDVSGGFTRCGYQLEGRPGLRREGEMDLEYYLEQEPYACNKCRISLRKLMEYGYEKNWQGSGKKYDRNQYRRDSYYSGRKYFSPCKKKK